MDANDQALAKVMVSLGQVVDVQPLHGGCISQAMRVRYREQDSKIRSVLVKYQDKSFLDNYRCEADGLQRLAEVGAISVPKPLVVDSFDDSAFLVMQWVESINIPSGSAEHREADFFERFGRELADLHRKSAGHRIGLETNNYLGSARQINRPLESWAAFVCENRVGFQMRWAIDQRLLEGSLWRDLDRLITVIPDLLIGRENKTSLLHGDLWSGNYLMDRAGRPVIIDPAVYHGCREAEFGMLLLFGGCPQSFYEAYQDQYPMPEGWRRRTRVYILYHLLNHLNLFGRTYLRDCQVLTSEILRDS